MTLELFCAAASGDQFVEFAGRNPRQTIEAATSAGDLRNFVDAADTGKLNFLSYCRVVDTSRRSVWVARARSWWWAYRGSGFVLTDANAPPSPPHEWHCYEMPEPFWGDWHVLPFWAAVDKDEAIERAWAALSGDEKPGGVAGVRFSTKDFKIEKRHERAVERGAALLSDWDDLEQPFPQDG